MPKQLVSVMIEITAKIYPGEADPQRNGLSNMRQRAEGVGGDCRITARRAEDREWNHGPLIHPHQRVFPRWITKLRAVVRRRPARGSGNPLAPVTPVAQ